MNRLKLLLGAVLSVIISIRLVDPPHPPATPDGNLFFLLIAVFIPFFAYFRSSNETVRNFIIGWLVFWTFFVTAKDTGGGGGTREECGLHGCYTERDP